MYGPSIGKEVFRKREFTTESMNQKVKVSLTFPDIKIKRRKQNGKRDQIG
jgi:hypothetical protein